MPNIYLYDVQHTIEVEAENEDEAYRRLLEYEHKNVTYIDSDFILIAAEHIQDKED